MLFLWLSFSIYEQVKAQGDLQQSWNVLLQSFTGPQSWKIILVLLLMPVASMIEAWKWQTLVNRVQRVSYWKAIKAIFSGQAIAFNSINRIGEAAARAIYLDEGFRLKGMAISFIGSMSQIIIVLVFGLMGLFYMRIFIFDATHHLEALSMFWLTALMTLLIIGTGLFLLLYFKLSWLIRLLEKIPLVSRYRFIIESMEELPWSLLTKVLLLSAFRYIVIVVQYMLLLQVFETGISMIDAAALVYVMLLVMSLIPTIALAELGFRGKVSLQVLSLVSSNTVGIIATAAGIWIINLTIPAIAGSLFLLGFRLFRNHHKEQV